MTAVSPPDELHVADWRRQVAELYAAVRAASDPLHARRHWLERRRALYAEHPASPVPVAQRPAHAVEAFPYDRSLRTLADVEPLPREALALPSSTGDSHRFLRFGGVRFTLRGSEHALDLYWLETYGNGLFLPFADPTNGTTTYGGGRYLLDTVKGADLGVEGGRLVLDFNFAYAPSCAWDGRWSCPLAPASNRLPAPIEGGELAPGRIPCGRGVAARS